ncbi:class I SAM-dependent methyltransferase [Hyphomonas sp. UBA1474]|uniref:class I SAM-dependent methyltransferase n=1 Tax=Hyphomonas sp. UBA1474 TaxID=1946614 RepID=UPI0039C8B3B9
MSFGIRNFADRLGRITGVPPRVETGRTDLAVLEFSHMTVPALQAAYDTYSFNVIPRLGSLDCGRCR